MAWSESVDTLLASKDTRKSQQKQDTLEGQTAELQKVKVSLIKDKVMAHTKMETNFSKHLIDNVVLTRFMEYSDSEILHRATLIGGLLQSGVGLAAFRAFLKSEFSEENIEFWLACEDYKKTRSSTKIMSKARKIYSEFIENEAPKEINIDFKTRDTISKNISQPTVACFDEAQKIILRLMAKDSFPRFLRSDAYKELREKQQNGNQKRWLSFL
ncbi:regulator of G-protein signaling 21 [Microcaecilia unicolor]|uniref:Regulator of G-protein signaling 21 n=1 Tax=Microcaecilia unicolor TaxID=1415580 RepID=A0A6P7YC43_9AMPH|nr:regulator of G-protein signaling 21 [Microcaecilia unicolor]